MTVPLTQENVAASSMLEPPVNSPVYDATASSATAAGPVGASDALPIKKLNAAQFSVSTFEMQCSCSVVTSQYGAVSVKR